MAGKAPGKGSSLLEIADMFRDEDTARERIGTVRGPQGPCCPHCGSFDVQAGIRRRTMTRRCRECGGKPMFTRRTGSVMAGTKMPCRAWAVGRLERSGRLARRCERTAASFRSFIALAAAFILIRSVHRAGVAGAALWSNHGRRDHCRAGTCFGQVARGVASL